MIYVRPQGGLCNAIRVMLSAYTLNLHTNNCALLWYPDYPHVPFTYGEIFDTNIIEHIYNYLPNVNNRYTDIVKEYTLNDFINVNGNILIDSCVSFIPFDKELYKLIKFKQEYIDIAKTIIIHDNIIGVHIRRSDFVSDGFPISNTEDFIHHINTEIQNDPTVKFFIATDDKSTEDVLLNMFGDKIIVYSKINGYNRYSQLYVKDGIIDLLCLSYCKKIYGSKVSSYTTAASGLNGVELVIV